MALGVASTVAAVWFSQLMTPDVPVVIEDGQEYSEGGLFGNLFEALAWFFVGFVLFVGGAIWLAIKRRGSTGVSSAPGRVWLVLLGPLIVAVLAMAGVSFLL